METCVKKECPFIPYCKHYRLDEDKGAECETQERLLAAANVLRKRRGQTKNGRA